MIRGLDDLISAAPNIRDDDIPKVIGKIEELKAILWPRLLQGASSMVTNAPHRESFADSALLKRLERLEADELRGKRLLSVPEAARALCLRPMTIYAWISHRKIEHVKLGRRVSIHIDTVERLLRDGTVPARRWE